MDKKAFIRAFIKELKDLFINLNKTEKRYSEVWLSEIDFGGLYYSDKYILNVKMEHHLESIIPEILNIADIVRNTLDKDKMPYVYSISVHNDNERIWHEREDIILYDEDLYAAA